MVLFMEFSPGRTHTLSFELELACLQKYLTKIRDLLLGEEPGQPMRAPAKEQFAPNLNLIWILGTKLLET